MEEHKLKCVCQWRRPDRSRTTAVISAEIRELFERHIEPKYKRNMPLMDMLERLLPAELSKHVKVTNINNQTIYIAVDNPSYLYELKLCQEDILTYIQRNCPSSRIRKIKLSLG